MQRRTVLGTGIAIVTASFLPRAGDATEGATELILNKLHALRHDRRLPHLRLSPALARMARLQALQMRRLGYTTHYGPDGDDPVTRGVQAGYEGHIRGEALAETYEGPASTVDLWIADDETRAVLLDPEAQDVGVFGIGTGARLTHWDLVVGA